MSIIATYTKVIMQAIVRRKYTASENVKLMNRLNLFDLTFLSMGTSIGMGVFAYIGSVSYRIGPGVILTYLYTSLEVFISVLCYAEFSSREGVGGCGGAYTYTYVYIGEFAAFTVGVLLICSNVAGAAFVLNGVMDLFDTAMGQKITQYLLKNWTFNTIRMRVVPGVLTPPIMIVVFLIVRVAGGVTVKIGNVFGTFNMILMILITLVSGANLNWKNWSLPPEPGCGRGGFLPFGVRTLIADGRFVYYSFLGFDAASHAGAEVMEPERFIPQAMLLSIGIMSVLYFLFSFAHTLQWSYCDQDLHEPVPYVLNETGIYLIAWLARIGGPIGIFGCLLIRIYPMSRIIYSLAEDGLLFTFLSKVHNRTKTPLNAMYAGGVIATIGAFFFNDDGMGNIAALASLLVYSLVAVFVLMLRYSDPRMKKGTMSRGIIRTILNLEPKSERPTVISSNIVRVATWTIFVTSFILGYYAEILEKHIYEEGENIKIIALVAFSILFLIVIWLTFIIWRQPQTAQQSISFRIMCPFIPVLCIVLNNISTMEYQWLVVPIILGISYGIYFFYGMWHCKLYLQKKETAKVKSSVRDKRRTHRRV